MTTISKLKLKNFKTFKSATVPFSKGFTAISGPNGSGKSNLLDGLLFALGITSLKTLRAGKLTDLIYNKSKDNYSDVVVEIGGKNPYKISRMIDKHGKAVYRLNEKKTTLGEINTLLLEIGLTPSGHNILIQGDIAKIIKMSAKERRTILDEVSGIKEFEEKKEAALKELDKVDLKLKETRIILKERQKRLEELAKEKEAAVKYKDLQQRCRQAKATILSKEMQAIELELKECNKSFVDIGKKVEALKDSRLKIEEEIKAAEKEIEEINNKLFDSNQKMYSGIGKDIEEKRTDISIGKERVKALENHNNKINARIHELNHLKADLELKKKEKEKEFRELTEKVDQLEKALSEKRARYDEVFDGLKESNTEIKTKEQELNQLFDEERRLAKNYEEIREKISELREAYVQGKTKISTIKSFTTEPREIKALKDSGITGIEGTIGELCSYNKENALALEALAGGKLNALVVKDVGTAVKCISYLKKIQLGRITFIPLDRIKGKKIGEEPKKLLEHEGVIDYAIRLVNYDHSYQNAMEYIFGDSIVVESLAKTKSLVGKARMVSLDGDIALEQGAMIGGGKSSGISLKEMKEIEEKEQEIKEWEEKRRELLTKLEEIRAERRSQKLAELLERTKSSSPELNELNQKIKELEEKRSTRYLELSTVKAELVQGINEKIDSTIREIEELRKEIAENQEEIKAEEERNKIVGKELTELEVVLGKQGKENLAMMERKDRIIEEIHSKQGKKEEVSKETELLEKQKSDLLIEKSRNETRLEDLGEQYKEYKEVELLKEGLEKLKASLPEMEERLQSFGAINMKAIENHEAYLKEVGEVRDKTDQLEKERISVLDMIKKIDVRRDEKFMDCFNQINSNFNQVFKILAGGEGRLSLNDPQNILESGLVIEAKMKDHPLRIIDAMSGGEKTLTTMAFIFAIQKYEPSPFYILDEADAALDAQNSSRLAKMIKEISKYSQVIAITHNEEVIKEADQIIGVALDKDKSSVIGLRLKEQIRSDLSPVNP